MHISLLDWDNNIKSQRNGKKMRGGKKKEARETVIYRSLYRTTHCSHAPTAHDHTHIVLYTHMLYIVLGSVPRYLPITTPYYLCWQQKLVIRIHTHTQSPNRTTVCTVLSCESEHVFCSVLFCLLKGSFCTFVYNLKLASTNAKFLLDWDFLQGKK